MATTKSVWWIEQRRPGGNERLRHYGPYANQEMARHKIKQLRFTARYRKADLVASEEAISSSNSPDTPVDPPV